MKTGEPQESNSCVQVWEAVKYFNLDLINDHVASFGWEEVKIFLFEFDKVSY